MNLLAVSQTALLSIGFIATSLTAIASVPQLIKTIKTRDTKSISLLMFLVLTLGYTFWLIYGCLLLDLPMIIGNSIGISFQLVIISFKIYNLATKKDQMKKLKKEDK